MRLWHNSQDLKKPYIAIKKYNYFFRDIYAMVRKTFTSHPISQLICGYGIIARRSKFFANIFLISVVSEDTNTSKGNSQVVSVQNS